MKKSDNETCWICGAKANSGEHLLKASDIRLYYPKISQKKPIYGHDRYRKNITIGSASSKRLHLKAKICEQCNNTLSQPYDKAWEKLSNYLYKNRNLIKRRGYFDLKKVFNRNFNKQATHLQLYFIKLFGCLFWDTKEDKKICKGFSHSLKTGQNRKDVYLEFNTNFDDDSGITDFLVDTTKEFGREQKLLALCTICLRLK